MDEVFVQHTNGREERVAVPTPTEKRKPGRPPRAPLDQFDASKLRSNSFDPAEPPCPVCDRATPRIELGSVHELVRAARERIQDEQSVGDSAKTDLMHLAARLDGYCSLRCYRTAE